MLAALCDCAAVCSEPEQRWPAVQCCPAVGLAHSSHACYPLPVQLCAVSLSNAGRPRNAALLWGDVGLLLLGRGHVGLAHRMLENLCMTAAAEGWWVYHCKLGVRRPSFFCVIQEVHFN